MPEASILKRLISELKSQGMAEGKARAIATSQMQKAGNVKKGSLLPTAKGKKRGAMTPEQRAKTRAKKITKKRK